MVKCIHDECRWPECDKTCGLVSKEKVYVVGSSAEEGLIYHLQGRIAELKAELTECRNVINDARITLDTMRPALIITSFWDDYERACKHGYADCVCDPGYLKKHHNKWWIELGMPTTCDDCDCGECYDDEDK